MSIDPRTIKAAVQRVMLARRVMCTYGDHRRNVVVSTGDTWDGREPCGAFASYATVRNGRVSPRCEIHAKVDAENMGIQINETPMFERKAGRKPKSSPKPQRPDPANPLNGIVCLTSAAARLFNRG